MSTNKQSIEELKETVALSHRLLYHTGLATTRGHSSALIPGTNKMLIKSWPHIYLNKVIAEDIIVMDLDGNILEGKTENNTSVSEWPLHSEVYKANSDVGGVIHTHQKWASLVCIAGKNILPVVAAQFAHVVAEPLPVMDEDKGLIRRVEQGQLVAKIMGDAAACHLQNHGMVFAGPNLETATMEAIHIEYEAEITWRAMLVGTPLEIPALYMRPHQYRRKEGGVDEAWEHYWKWVDQHPESLRFSSVQV